MAGTVDLMQRCFTGIETRAGVLWFNPRLPSPLRCLRLQLHYCGFVVDVEITHRRLRLSVGADAGRPLRIGVNGVVEAVDSDSVREFVLDDR